MENNYGTVEEQVRQYINARVDRFATVRVQDSWSGLSVKLANEHGDEADVDVMFDQRCGHSSTTNTPISRRLIDRDGEVWLERSIRIEVNYSTHGSQRWDIAARRAAHILAACELCKELQAEFGSIEVHQLIQTKEQTEKIKRSNEAALRKQMITAAIGETYKRRHVGSRWDITFTKGAIAPGQEVIAINTGTVQRSFAVSVYDAHMSVRRES